MILGYEHHDLPGKSNAATISHAVPQDLARDNVIASENGVEFLLGVKKKSSCVERVLTDSVSRLGRFER